MADETLAEEVAALSDQVKVLREVLDEIRVELGWANDNARDLVHGAGAVTASMRIVSMARDPTACDFAVNSVPADVVDQLRENVTADSARGTSSQATLF